MRNLNFNFIIFLTIAASPVSAQSLEKTYVRPSDQVYVYSIDRDNCIAQTKNLFVSWESGWCSHSNNDKIIIKSDVFEGRPYVRIFTWGSNRNSCSVSGIATRLEDGSLLLEEVMSGSKCSVKIEDKNGSLSSTVLEGCQYLFCGPEASLNKSEYKIENSN